MGIAHFSPAFLIDGAPQLKNYPMPVAIAYVLYCCVPIGYGIAQLAVVSNVLKVRFWVSYTDLQANIIRSFR